MSRFARGIGLAALALLTLAACEDASGPDGGEEVVLGGLFSLTGNWSTLGKTSQAAMELAVEDVNAYLDGEGTTFRVDVRDTRLEPATALTALQSLRGSGVRVVIGPQSSAELAAIRSYVDANPILLVSQSSTAGSLAIAGDRVYRFTPADSLEGIAVSALMWDDGVRAVVPIWRADEGNRGLRTATSTRFAAQGGTVVEGIEYATTTTNFTATVATLGTRVRQALATRPASQVAVYLAGFDEITDLFAKAAADPVLASVRWYGGDGVAQSAALLGSPATVAFTQRVSFVAPIFGLDATAQEKWGPVAQRIRTRAAIEPDAFALAVYDAVWVAALAHVAGGPDSDVAELQARFVGAASSYYGATGWTLLNAAGDRRHANFDFWAIRPSGASHTWQRVAGYDTRLGTLDRP